MRNCKRIFYSLTLITAFFLLIGSASAETVTNWPVDFSEPWNDLSSPFGPRLKASEDYRYDYHRGIDIPGETTDQVICVKDGVVFRIFHEGEEGSPYPSGGTVVIVRHNFDEPYSFHGTQTTYYSLYMHLDSVETGLTQDDNISAGDRVGYIGQTGTTNYDHLHFEFRIGTTYSLEHENNHGYDPHINALNFLSHSENNNVEGSALASGNDITVALSIPREDLDLNRYEITSYNSSGTALKEKILDFDLREGIDASTTEAIDTPEYDGIHIDPSRFNQSSSTEDIAVTFRDMVSSQSSRVQIYVEDVHENQLFLQNIYINADGDDDNGGGSNPAPENPPDASENEHGKITNVEKIQNELLLTYKDGYKETISPFNNQKKFKYHLSSDQVRILTCNGKYIKSFQDGMLVAQKKIKKKKPKKLKTYLFKVGDLYKKYDNVIFIYKKVNEKKAKLVVYRLSNSNKLRKRQIKKPQLYKNELNAISLKKKKDSFAIYDMKCERGVWKIAKKGRLIRIK